MSQSTNLLVRRIVAQLIDCIVLYIGFQAYVMLFFANRASAMFEGVVELMTYIPFALLFGAFSEWFTEGYTFGKTLLQIRIVKEDGSLIGLKEVLLRWLANWLEIYFTAGILATLFVVFSKKGQRLGDKLAKTHLIKT
ncbi:RDD family protein [Flectobacillus major]|jgi:uncharacterized RDD family membrane protein YckC|uniref:RDD family protein n=1 Tax=Flectobacillus major TaxID=103 RepID=UPI00047D736C|nr:RDD family protein [Flectobacillus major]